MNRKEGIKIAACLAASVLLVFVDQWTKWLAKTYLKTVDTIPIIFQALHLTYQENRGAAFSILQGQRFWLIGVTALILAGMLVYLFLRKKPRSGMMLTAYALILAGGFGNLLDRIIHGMVIDFIDVRVVRFAIFNFADICVVCGVILMILYLLLGDRLPKPEPAGEAASEPAGEAASEPAEETASEPAVETAPEEAE